uniref:Transposase n=1 Tax=Rhizobium meliloti TaxID=382 RepID=I2E220_RHIML|nr:transposase [Sinorhizobium meliloti]
MADAIDFGAPKAPSYIFGAICPKLGKAAALVMPWCDTHAMNQHLTEISHHVAEDAHAVLIMDQAGWHMSNALIVPANITIPAATAEVARTQPRRKPLAIHAR